MEKLFKGLKFTNKKKPALNETNLNAIVEAIDAIDDRVIETEDSKLANDGDSKDNKTTFTQASVRANINSGESHATIFGKISKFFADLKTVAFSGSYTDLSNKPTIGNGTLTIQKNGKTVKSFTANQTGNATVDIEVPTKLSELENDNGFLDFSGGELSDDSHSMNVLPTGLQGDDTQTLSSFSSVQAQKGDFSSLETEALRVSSDANIEGDATVDGLLYTPKAAIDEAEIEKLKLQNLDMDEENIENVGHIRGRNGQDIDCDGQSFEIGIRDKDDNWVSLLSFDGGGNIKFNLTNEMQVNNIVTIGTDKVSNIIDLTQNNLSVGVNNKMNLSADYATFKGRTHFDIINQCGASISSDSTGNVDINAKRIELYSNSMEFESTSDIRMTSIKGKNNADGTKANITNIGNINCQTLNGKIAKYNVAVLADYTSVGRSLNDISWAQIKADVDSGNVNKYCVGDYKDITITTGYKFRMRIAGINTYSGRRANGNGYLGCHIDWISDECAFSTQYNSTNNNNGTESTKSPYVASAMYTYLNGSGVYDFLPSDLKAVISPKYLDIDGRYSSSGTLTYSNYYLWYINMGKVWLPTEFEIIGTVCKGSTNGTSIGSGGQRQYPLFRDYPRFTQKRDCTASATDPNMQSWWTSTPTNGDSTSFVISEWTGIITSYSASLYLRVPICVRISASSYN